MDAKPVKTHIRAYRAFRIIGTILTISGATVACLSLFVLIFTLFMNNGLSASFASNPEFVAFFAQNRLYLTAYSITLGVFAMHYFATGIVFLALSTRAKILDANRGIDY